MLVAYGGEQGRHYSTGSRYDKGMGMRTRTRLCRWRLWRPRRDRALFLAPVSDKPERAALLGRPLDSRLFTHQGTLILVSPSPALKSVAVSLPVPPSKTSAPSPPVSRSWPLPPSRVSAPSPPVSWSSPAPPRSVSSPAPPSSRSWP